MPDPQLHSHVVITSAIRDDGKLVAVASRPIFRSARELGAYYRSALAHHLQQQGYAIQRGTGKHGRYFEIAGVPRGLLDAFSARSREVARAAERFRAQYGRAPERGELRALKLENRKAKVLVTRSDLQQAWNDTAARFDFAARQAGRPSAALVAAGEQALEDRVEQRLTERAATFQAGELRATILEQSVGELSQRSPPPVAETSARRPARWQATRSPSGSAPASQTSRPTRLRSSPGRSVPRSLSVPPASARASLSTLPPELSSTPATKRSASPSPVPPLSASDKTAPASPDGPSPSTRSSPASSAASCTSTSPRRSTSMRRANQIEFTGIAWHISGDALCERVRQAAFSAIAIGAVMKIRCYERPEGCFFVGPRRGRLGPSVTTIRVPEASLVPGRRPWLVTTRSRRSPLRGRKILPSRQWARPSARRASLNASPASDGTTHLSFAYACRDFASLSTASSRSRLSVASCSCATLGTMVNVRGTAVYVVGGWPAHEGISALENDAVQ